jgi:hypothetical protein
MALAGLLAVSAGCTATLENDDHDWGGDKDSDRWYTAGARFEHPAVASEDDSLHAAFDRLVLEVAGTLPTTLDGPGTEMDASSVLGLQIYTPENTRTTLPVPGDRPYAGWVYFGVVRHDTRLDSDALRRRDEQSSVELDFGLVGPSTHMDDLQTEVHGWFGTDEAEGWDNQLDDEPGVVLRATRRWRLDYGEPGWGLAYDLSPRVDGALGNIDTHVGAGGVARLGVNLSRALDPALGDPRSTARQEERPASLYLFAGVDGRFVAHNLFLDGNTFEDSLSVNEERLVGETQFGLGFDLGAWRLALSRHVRTREFEDQPDDQAFGSITVSWTPAL